MDLRWSVRLRLFCLISNYVHIRTPELRHSERTRRGRGEDIRTFHLYQMNVQLGRPAPTWRTSLKHPMNVVVLVGG